MADIPPKIAAIMRGMEAASDQGKPPVSVLQKWLDDDLEYRRAMANDPETTLEDPESYRELEVRFA